VVLALLLPARAAAQSPWARGDRAFRAGRFAEAESLYALRLKRGGPAEVRVNRATAEALKGGAQDAQRDLEPLAGRSDLAGREAGYNLGTLLGLQRQYDSALDALRRVLERDPGDQDARWNYEVLMRKKEEERRSPDKNPPPKPSPSGGGGGANQSPANPRPAPSTGSLPAPQSAGAPPQPQSSGGGRMTRAEAGQLLDALQELSRVEQQRQRKVRVTREKQGRDW
jgi:Ca-activated chloride channel family protein